MNTTETSFEGFEDPVIDAIQDKLQNESPEQLKSTVQALQQRLIDYGYAPDVNTFVKRTELGPNDGKCLVSNSEDRDKYISKSDIPLSGPRIDLSQYVKKSSIPPEKVCAPAPEIDYSAYVKKSTLPPNEKCPPCISPKVKVSAGLCRECPPMPSCPAPQRCPSVKCPLPAPCPQQKDCPAPAPCPTLGESKKCDEIRYIKVPAVITKTVMVDANGNIISQKIDSGNANSNENSTNNTNTNNPVATPTHTHAATPTYTHTPIHTHAATIPTHTTKQIYNNNNNYNDYNDYNEYNNDDYNNNDYNNNNNNQTLFNSLFNSSNNDIPTTTFPIMSTTQPNTTLAQSLAGISTPTAAFCPSSDLNSEFKSYGIYGKK